VARYGQAFKDKAVARLLPPESAAIEVIAQELGVSVDTLERWRGEALSRPARAGLDSGGAVRGRADDGADGRGGA
jgi:transposase-like protein